MIQHVAEADKDFLALYTADPVAAVELITKFGESEGTTMFKQWRLVVRCFPRPPRAYTDPGKFSTTTN